MAIGLETLMRMRSIVYAFLDFIRHERKLRYLFFRIGARVLLGKVSRDRLLEAYLQEELFKKMRLSRRAIGEMKRRVTYVGCLGHENLGDEALYQLNRKVFKPYQLIPEMGTAHYSRITLFGGGTLLPTFASVITPNEYNYAYGVGVRNPSFWGEFDSSLIEQVKKFNFRYLGVRGDASKRLLEDWGIDSEVVGDPCLLLEPSHYEKKDRKEGGRNIAVNAGSAGWLWGGNQERVFREVAKLCRALKKSGYRPILVPFYKNNLNEIQRVSEVTSTPILKDWMDIQKVLDLIASCRILIGEKLHSVVFSAATYTPFISIEYTPKCRDFAETMGFGEYITRTDEMTSKKVMVKISDLLHNWDEMYEKLVRNVDFYRSKLRRSAELIKKDIQMNLHRRGALPEYDP